MVEWMLGGRWVEVVSGLQKWVRQRAEEMAVEVKGMEEKLEEERSAHRHALTPVMLDFEIDAARCCSEPKRVACLKCGDVRG